MSGKQGVSHNCSPAFVTYICIISRGAQGAIVGTAAEFGQRFESPHVGERLSNIYTYRHSYIHIGTPPDKLYYYPGGGTPTTTTSRRNPLSQMEFLGRSLEGGHQLKGRALFFLLFVWECSLVGMGEKGVAVCLQWRGVVLLLEPRDPTLTAATAAGRRGEGGRASCQTPTKH